MNVLFVCGRNALRSPTAETVFGAWPGIETDSAGLNDDCDNPVTSDAVTWADVIFVMERKQQSKLMQRFARYLKDKRVVCLNIADKYALMDPALIALLEVRVPPHLTRRGK